MHRAQLGVLILLETLTRILHSRLILRAVLYLLRRSLRLGWSCWYSAGSARSVSFPEYFLQKIHFFSALRMAWVRVLIARAVRRRFGEFFLPSTALLAAGSSAALRSAINHWW